MSSYAIPLIGEETGADVTVRLVVISLPTFLAEHGTRRHRMGKHFFLFLLFWHLRVGEVR